MKRIIRLTESDLKRIVRRVIKESEMNSEVDISPDDAKMALNKILDRDEIEFLKNHFESQGKQGFKMDVKNAIQNIEGGDELYEEEDMDEDEYKLRDIVNKIIKKGGSLAALGVIPAAMLAGPAAGVALGITSLVAMLFKDSAFWKKGGGIHRKELEKSDKEMGSIIPRDY